MLIAYALIAYALNISFLQVGTADSVDKWGHEGFDEIQRRPSPPRLDPEEVGYVAKVTNLHFDVIDEDLKVRVSSLRRFPWKILFLFEC